jgi:hypothetical protein
VLTSIPNDINNIAASLERQLVLRRFNKDHLKMEISSGSDLNKIIGIGTRLNPDTGRHEPVTTFYDSYINQVVWDFSQYPIYKQFGITVKDAMELPVDYWNRIRRSAIALAVNAPEDTETTLLKILKEVLSKRGGDE